jgi:L-alanine-DL-glutamate epimerase-like enolase superfamily enzyme
MPVPMPFTAGGPSGEGGSGGAGLQRDDSLIVAVTTDTGAVGWGDAFGFTTSAVTLAPQIKLCTEA